MNIRPFTTLYVCWDDNGDRTRTPQNCGYCEYRQSEGDSLESIAKSASEHKVRIFEIYIEPDYLEYPECFEE